MEKREKATVSEKVAGKITGARTAIIVVLAVVIVAIAAFAVATSVTEKSNKKGLTAIDSISYTLTKDSSGISAEDLEGRRNTAIAALSTYTKKNGVVGVRANMLAGEITYGQKKYEDAAGYWEAAANKGKKAYTASLCNFNAAAAYEELNNLDKAEKCYAKAAADKEFVQAAHAKFSLGRVREAKNDLEGAKAAYKDLTDSNPDDTFAKLAKSRLIALELSAN